MCPCLTISGISIGVILGLALGNYFDTSIGSLICYSVDLELVTLIGTLMGSLFGNYLGMSLESFIELPFYFCFVSLIEVLFESDS